jgi:hypothetical protein
MVFIGDKAVQKTLGFSKCPLVPTQWHSGDQVVQNVAGDVR